MYDFVDRPVTSLSRGGRLLVWAMRHWVRAASAGRCPCGDVAPAFHKRDLMASFPHFHVMMAVFNSNAILKLNFGGVDCARVSEHEALILSLLRAVPDAPIDTTRNIAGMIVRPAAVGTLMIALSALAEGLSEANLLPVAPISDSECMRFTDE